MADATTLGTKSISWTTVDGNIVNPLPHNMTNPTVDAPGTYVVTITNTSNDCFTVRSVLVEQNITPPTIQIDVPQELTCSRLELSLSSSATSVDLSPLTFAWVAGAGGNIVSGLNTPTPVVNAVADYTLTVTDQGNGCPNSSLISVSEDVLPPDVSVDTNPNPITCDNPTVLLNGSSTYPNKSYQWTGAGPITNSTTETPSVSVVGIYNLTVENLDNNCKATSVNVNVGEDLIVPAVAVAAPSGDLTCTVTEVTVSVTDNSDYNYSWSGPGSVSAPNSYTTTVDAAGTYEVIVEDIDNGCSDTFTVDVIEDKIPIASPLVNDTETCYGTANPPFNVITGTNVRWYNDATLSNQVFAGNTYTPLNTTVGDHKYYATSTGANGCESLSTEVILTIHDLPAVPSTTGNAICEGSAAKTITAVGSNIKWYDNTSVFIVGGSSYIPTDNVAGTYTYYATQTDANTCESTQATTTYTINSVPISPVYVNPNIEACETETNPEFTVVGDAGSTIKWYKDIVGAVVSTGNTHQPDEIIPGTHTYFATQTVNACESPVATGDITIHPMPVKYNVTGGGSYCENGAGMLVGLSDSETGVRYELWLNETTLISDLAGTTGSALDFGNQTATGSYSVYAYNTVSLCRIKMNGGVSIVINPLPGDAGPIAGSANVCQTETGITYTVDPISDAINYIWTVPTGFTIVSGDNSNSISVNIENTAVDSSINVYAKNSCGTGNVSPELFVTVNPIPDDAGVITGPSVICNDEDGVVYSIAAVTGATHYNWTLPQGATIVAGADSRQITLDFDHTAVNDEIIVFAANDCGEGTSASLSISVTDLPYVSAGDQQDLCADNTVLDGSPKPATGTGVWSIYTGAVTFANTGVSNTAITDIGEGINRLVWTVEESGCSVSDTVLITNNQVIVEAGNNEVICSESIVLAGSNVPADAVGSWSVITGAANFADGNNPNTTATEFATGSNILKWSIVKGGCSNYDTLIVDNQRPTLAYAGIDQSICEDTTILEANDPSIGTGLWTVTVGAANFANDGEYNTVVTGLSKGENVLRWTITNGICNTFDEVSIINNKVIVNAGVDQVVCDRTTVLDAQEITADEEYWSVVSGSAVFVFPDEYNTLVTGLSKGPNVLTWNVNNNGCISSDTVTIVNDSPTEADAGEDTTVLIDFITLQGNVPIEGTGVWTLISGSANIENPTIYNTNVTSLGLNENIFRWTISKNSCISTDDVIVTNYMSTETNAGPDQSICSDETILEGNEPLYYGQWSVVKGTAIIANPDNAITTVTSLAKGDNILRWSVWQNGWTYDDVVISNDSPTSANAGSDQVLCADSITLSANEPIVGSGIWTVISGSGQFENDTIYNTKVTNLAQGENVFKWEITYKSCSNNDMVSITNDAPTVASAGEDHTICSNTIALNPNTPTIGVGEWSVIGGAANFEGNVVTHLASDTNILRWTITLNGCSSYDELTVINNEPSDVRAGADKVICYDSILLAGNIPVVGTGIWTVQSGAANIIDISSSTSKVTDINPGVNVFRWTVNYNGCTKIDEVTVNNATAVAITGEDQNICSESTVLDANNPETGTGMWSILGGSGSALFEDASEPDTRVDELDQGANILRWTVTNDVCISHSDVVITNNLPTDAFAGPDQSLCADNTILQGSNPLIGIGEWSVLSGSATIASPNSASSNISNLSYGVNTLRWTTTNVNCISTDEVVIANNSTESSNAGVDQSICKDSTVLYANTPTFGLGQWSVMSGSATFINNNEFNTKVKDLGKGENILRWVISNDECSSEDEVLVSNNSPTKAIAGADQTTCGDHTFLQANIPIIGTGQWNLVSGAANFVDDTQNNTEVAGLNPGENTIRWIISNLGCESTDDVIINNDLPYEADAGSDFEICGPITSLYANDPVIGDGQWTVISGSATFDDPTKFDATVSDMEFGANTFKWTIDYDQCTTYDEVIVTNNKLHVNAGSDQTITESSTLLTASNPSSGSGQWSVIGGTGEFKDANNAITMVSALGSGLNTFRWTVNINGCNSIDDISITYNVPPVPSFVITASEGCPPLDVYFVNNSLDELPFTWDFDDGTFSDKITIKHTYLEQGVYNPSLTIIGDKGEVIVKDTTITVYNQPNASFLIVNKQVYIPEEEAIFVNTSTDAVTYKWEFGEGTTSTESDPRYIYDTEGIYDIILHVWSENECYDSIKVVGGVEVYESGAVVFPNAFTPNLDGPSGGVYNPLDFTNDVFYPIGEGVENYRLEIFNKWGVLIFESSEVNIGWDGYYDNKLLDEGVYVWKVTGKYNNGKDFKKVGTVLLLH